MNLALKIICGLFGVLMALFGVRWWFAFEGIELEWQVAAQNAVGINNLMADMGALFVGSAVMIALGLFRNAQWLLPAALLMLIAAIGRLLAFATSGYTGEVLVALIVEIVAAVILYLTYTRRATA